WSTGRGGSSATRTSARGSSRLERRRLVMAATRLLLATLPACLMIACAIGMTGIEQWLAGFGQSDNARMTLGRIGLALPYVMAGAAGLIFLFAAAGAVNIK